MRDSERLYRRGGGTGTDIAGLISMYYLNAAAAYACEKLGYGMYIDYEHYTCQYNVDREIHGTRNAWEYYFSQPRGICISDVENSSRIIYSGWRLTKDRKRTEFGSEFNQRSPIERRKWLKNTFSIQPWILEIEKKKADELLTNHCTLGLFLRGTDYVIRKPIGHERQPELIDVFRKVDEFLTKYPIDQIFLVTEDAGIFKKVKDRYREKIICSDYNFVNFDPAEDRWLVDAFTNDPYERGVNYLVRVMLLARCDYFVGSHASGSRWAEDFGDYKDRYFFELGTY